MTLLQELTETMYMDPDERRAALARAKEQMTRQAKALRRRRPNREAVRKGQEQIEARKREHERRLKTDPEYRARYEQELKQTSDAWKSYGEARNRGEIQGRGPGGSRNWTGD